MVFPCMCYLPDPKQPSPIPGDGRSTGPGLAVCKQRSPHQTVRARTCRQDHRFVALVQIAPDCGIARPSSAIPDFSMLSLYSRSRHQVEILPPLAISVSNLPVRSDRYEESADPPKMLPPSSLHPASHGCPIAQPRASSCPRSPPLALWHAHISKRVPWMQRAMMGTYERGRLISPPRPMRPEVPACAGMTELYNENIYISCLPCAGEDLGQNGVQR